MFYVLTINSTPFPRTKLWATSKAAPYLLLPSRWSCVTNPRDTMKASFCARETRMYFSLGSHKANCMFLVRLLGKASPMGWSREGRRPGSGDQRTDTFQSHYGGFLVSKGSQKKDCGLHLLLSQWQKSASLSALIFFAYFSRKILWQGREFHTQKTCSGYNKEPPIQQAPSSKYFTCHSRPGFLTFLLPMTGQC